MPVQNFLTVIQSSLSRGQKNILHRFLEDANSGRLQANATEIQAALNQVGSILPDPGLDVTDPNGFNNTLSTVLANISGLYQEIDRVESTQDRLADLNSAELSRIETALQDLQTILDSTRRAHAENTQWTDVFYETFGASINREDSPEWYQPLPALAATGQVESFLPLVVDPEDHSLKLLTGGEFSRSTNSQGQPLAHVEVDEILGLSVDPNHGIDQAVDGKFYTYWRELVVADSPIDADVRQVPWLPGDYQGGTAARIRFKFSFAVPFTELVIRPFSRYPVQVLQLVWDNRKQPVSNFITNGNFSSGSVGWSVSYASGTVVTFLPASGYLNHPCVDILAASGRTTLTNDIFGFVENQPALHLHFFLNRAETIVPQVFVNWYTSGTAELISTEWIPPDTPFGEWFEYSRLFLAPSGAASGQLVLAADGSGDIKFSDVVFAKTLGQNNTLQTIPLESNSLVAEMDNATGTDIWVVVAQPHYDYVQLAIPEGELEQQTLWQDIRLQVEGVDESLFQFQPTIWSVAGGDIGNTSNVITDDGTSLIREVKRLGGKVKDIVVSLLKFASPSSRTITVNKFLYTLGAWEIMVKHHEFAPEGLFVTKPYHPRGEVREVLLQTDLTDLDGRVRFWMTARANDKSDKAQLFSGRATFSSATETPASTATTHFFLPPVSRRETFDGTDRSGRAALAFHPYINRETLWGVNNDISSGGITSPVKFDPNRDLYLIRVGNTLRNIAGYQPLKVTLNFPDGTIARPDILGKVQPGDISFAGPEILTPADVTQDQTTFNENDVEAPRRASVTQQIIPGTKKQKKKTQTVKLTALQTQFPNIISGVNGVTFSLYWHNPVNDTPSGGIITSSDVLISPVKYTVDAPRGVVVVRDTPPSGNTNYSQFIAYYYYQQDELGARQSLDSRATASKPTTGIDFIGSLNQNLPVTRNVTDYINGVIPTLRPAVLDDLAQDYYPVYEYYVDDRGRLNFANVLASFGDTPAQITVDYQTLEIEPRLLIEVTKGAINSFSTKTPVIRSFTLFMNSKR